MKSKMHFELNVQFQLGLTLAAITLLSWSWAAEIPGLKVASILMCSTDRMVDCSCGQGLPVSPVAAAVLMWSKSGCMTALSPALLLGSKGNLCLLSAESDAACCSPSAKERMRRREVQDLAGRQGCLCYLPAEIFFFSWLCENVVQNCFLVAFSQITENKVWWQRSSWANTCLTWWWW